MRETVRTDFLAGLQPGANLRGVHQGFGHIAVDNVPFVAGADQIGDDELNGAEAVAGECFEGILEDVAITIVKGDDHFLFRVRSRIGKVMQGAGGETILREEGQLFGEAFAGDVEKRIAGAARRLRDAVIGEHGDTVAKQAALRGTEEKLGRKLG